MATSRSGRALSHIPPETAGAPYTEVSISSGDRSAKGPISEPCAWLRVACAPAQRPGIIRWMVHHDRQLTRGGRPMTISTSPSDQSMPRVLNCPQEKRERVERVVLAGDQPAACNDMVRSRGTGALRDILVASVIGVLAAAAALAGVILVSGLARSTPVQDQRLTVDQPAPRHAVSRRTPSLVSEFSSAQEPVCSSTRKRLWSEDQGWIVRRVMVCR